MFGPPQTVSVQKHSLVSHLAFFNFLIHQRGYCHGITHLGSGKGVEKSWNFVNGGLYEPNTFASHGSLVLLDAL